MTINDLIQLEAPYFHIAVGDTALLYNLKVQAKELNKTEFKVIRGQKCKSVTGLLNEWAAFDECLNDLEWLPADSYILTITNSQLIFKWRKRDFKDLINTLKNAVQEWTGGRCYDSFPTHPTPFHIIFQCNELHIEAFQKKLIKAGIEELSIIQL